MSRYIDIKFLENMKEKMIALAETADDTTKIVLAAQIGTFESLIDCPKNIYADVEEVRHGEWIEDYGRECSCCGYWGDFTDDLGQWIPSNYCPNCGAKMDGGNE